MAGADPGVEDINDTLDEVVAVLDQVAVTEDNTGIETLLTGSTTGIAARVHPARDPDDGPPPQRASPGGLQAASALKATTPAGCRGAPLSRGIALQAPDVLHSHAESPSGSRCVPLTRGIVLQAPDVPHSHAC